jgi:hypothetical protein
MSVNNRETKQMHRTVSGRVTGVGEDDPARARREPPDDADESDDDEDAGADVIVQPAVGVRSARDESSDEEEGEDDEGDTDDEEDDDTDEDEADLDIESGAGTTGDIPAVSRKIRRRRRRTRPRSKTIAMKRLTREELRVGAVMFPPVDDQRPRTRADCGQEIRPCPWVACKFHLYLDVNPETGSIKINFPDLEPWEMKDTCSLDVAGRGGITLEEVGEIMNLTRERIRQVEVRGLLKLKMGSPSPDEIGAALIRKPGQ